MDEETYHALIKFTSSASYAANILVDTLADKNKRSSSVYILAYLDVLIFTLESITDILDEVELEDV